VTVDTTTPLHSDRPRSRVVRRQRTADLLARAQRARGATRRRLEDEVVRLNMGVARDVARRYHARGIPVEDLEQVAYVGLVKAVKGYQPGKAEDFLSYAVPTVRGELRRHFRDLGWTVRPPRSIQELQSKVTEAEGDLYQELGRCPRPSEIAARLDVSRDLVIEALSANGCFAPTSLDSGPGSGPEVVGIGERLGADDPSFDAAEARVALAPLMSDLTERERLMLEMRFFRGCTQAEIGAAIGITQMQVSRLLSALLARLRDRLTEPRSTPARRRSSHAA
jgi:RNA polymerase sigma-B factor